MNKEIQKLEKLKDKLEKERAEQERIVQLKREVDELNEHWLKIYLKAGLIGIGSFFSRVFSGFGKGMNEFTSDIKQNPIQMNDDPFGIKNIGKGFEGSPLAPTTDFFKTSNHFTKPTKDSRRYIG